jgi:hypothetical protein
MSRVAEKCLRFFCPAILGPKLFDLMKDHPEMKVARTLVSVLFYTFY